MKAQLVIGCHGVRRYGFSLCKGVSNAILDLRKLGSQEEEVLAYLDDRCKLFDKVADDWNEVNSIIQFVENNRLIPEHLMKVVQDFRALHRGCGLYAFVEQIPD